MSEFRSRLHQSQSAGFYEWSEAGGRHQSRATSPSWGVHVRRVFNEGTTYKSMTSFNKLRGKTAMEVVLDSVGFSATIWRAAWFHQSCALLMLLKAAMVNCSKQYRPACIDKFAVNQSAAALFKSIRRSCKGWALRRDDFIATESHANPQSIKATHHRGFIIDIAESDLLDADLAMLCAVIGRQILVLPGLRRATSAAEREALLYCGHKDFIPMSNVKPPLVIGRSQGEYCIANAAFDASTTEGAASSTIPCRSMFAVRDEDRAAMTAKEVYAFIRRVQVETRRQYNRGPGRAANKHGKPIFFICRQGAVATQLKRKKGLKRKRVTLEETQASVELFAIVDCSGLCAARIKFLCVGPISTSYLIIPTISNTSSPKSSPAPSLDKRTFVDLRNASRQWTWNSATGKSCERQLLALWTGCPVRPACRAGSRNYGQRDGRQPLERQRNLQLAKRRLPRLKLQRALQTLQKTQLWQIHLLARRRPLRRQRQRLRAPDQRATDQRATDERANSLLCSGVVLRGRVSVRRLE